jgi:ABC-type dipeptide/oligopeptide/nickel transport system permease component
VFRYIAGRLLQAIPVVVLSSIVIFGMLRLVPGDAAEVMAGSNATPEAIEAVRVANGLDQPLPAQYALWLAKVVRGDLGVSFFTKRPVVELLTQRIPATLELAFTALLLTILISIPAGVLAAVNQRKPIDWFISAASGTIIAVPGFWLGLLAIILFALVLGWLPPGGRGDFSRDPIAAAKFLLLPALTLALPPSAGLLRLVRTSVLETLHEDYVRTGRAKGLGDAPLLWRHVLRNALVPVITIVGLQFGALLGGAVVTEAVFSWPGVGSLIRDALAGRDYVVVQSCLLLLVLLFIVVNLVTDLAYGVLDPRIRLTGRVSQ